ncbi:nicotinate (nicotinamide) nucleotide adenylyltransferase [Polynucleobacter sp. AP-Elch-400A-B2]|uniref:nicotinate (nicotinamide) nucleotide adenylyltransferase n=1 Tax=Polynucleobacter sp. AP-Elch-400A-B2 TaxID=2576930 RepID=UPI001BFEA001|nr:nicotinate (nicotinamide) nucleotide adenylyltransferase [Polynucleobacter sp. AP-Elch-400A-B2]QWE25238.1 nicotinate (nicotinamide) nucleotide adenylyltransferase [Polynucleobacter sp. AP-Elch-400A-B2]
MMSADLGAPKKIGILGGTFDPPHLGHLKLAMHFAKLLHLDTLLLIPSGEPWQKSSGITPAEIRLELTEAAGIDLARVLLYLKIPTQIGVDRIEIDRAGPSYAIDTAKALRERFGPQVNITWLMGADSLINLPSWKSWDQLLDFVNFAVVSRPHHELSTLISPEMKALLEKHQCIDANALEKSLFGRIYLDNSLAVDISSTKLRSQLKSASRSDIAEHIPSHTLEIITNLGLYK